MSIEKISFENARGVKLAANLELPNGRRPHNYAIFAHCFTCTKNFNAVRHISSALASKGFGVLCFDFTGLGESEGEFADTNFSGSISDLIAAAEYLKNNYRAPSVIVGHSLGGAASLLAASQIVEIKAVATIGAPAAPQHVARLLQNSIAEIKETGSAQVDIGGRPFTIKKQFVEDLDEQNLLSVVREMRDKAFLFLHSPQDRIVSIDNAAELFRAAFHPKSFVSLDDADHLLSNKADAFYVGDLIASWAARYAEISEEKDFSTNSHIVAYLGAEGKFTTRIKAGIHELIADEPESVGGNAFGATPYELVAAGLAACTAMTLRLYADRKKWDLKEVFVHISHEKSHSEDCLNCDAATSKIDKFTRKLELVGDLDAEQKQRLLEIADKCPVHRTLEGSALISTKLLV
jgi:putative redox protein